MSSFQSILKSSFHKLNVSFGNALKPKFEINSSLKAPQLVDNIYSKKITTPLINHQNMIFSKPFQMVNYKFESCNKYEDQNHQKEQNLSKVIHPNNRTLISFSKPNLVRSLIKNNRFQFSKSKSFKPIKLINQKISQLNKNREYDQILKFIKSKQFKNLSQQERISIFKKTLKYSSTNKLQSGQKFCNYNYNLTNFILYLQTNRIPKFKIRNYQLEELERWFYIQLVKRFFRNKSVSVQIQQFKSYKRLVSICLDGYLTKAQGKGTGSHHGGPKIDLLISEDKKSSKMVKTPKREAPKYRKSKK